VREVHDAFRDGEGLAEAEFDDAVFQFDVEPAFEHEEEFEMRRNVRLVRRLPA
jgi:hypothetical protein